MIIQGKNITEQVIDYCLRQISSGIWRSGERIPSTKELALTLGVNNRTVMKAYDELTTMGLTYIQRGMGYYCCPDVEDRLLDHRRKQFFENTLPAFLEQARQCGIPLEDLQKFFI